MEENQVLFCSSMQIYGENSDQTPIVDFDAPKEYSNNIPKVIRFLAVNPYSKNLDRYEEAIKKHNIKGLKIYLGYIHMFPQDKAYLPFYRLAEKYNLIVVFHTGDTFSSKGKLKYSHPLNVDEVAVDFPKVSFVIAHFGEPWLMDTAEILYKNPNVYADLSGLMIGDLSKYKKYYPDRVRKALEFCGYDKVMYGTDWPLAPMDKYIKLIKRIIPKEHQQKVFFDNANKLFQLNM